MILNYGDFEGNGFLVSLFTLVLDSVSCSEKSPEPLNMVDLINKIKLV